MAVVDAARVNRVGVATACFAASALMTFSLTGPPAAEIDWSRALTACASDLSTRVFDPGCVETTWMAAFDAGDLPAFSQALLNLEQERPYLQAQCHDAGHAAGRYAFATTGQVSFLVSLAAQDRFACDNGFVHGVLDGLAASRPARQQVLDAFAACQALRDQARRNCLDGSGHLTWQVTREPAAAARLCLEYDLDLDRRTCYAGVTMQMFHPQLDGSGPADHLNEQAPAYLARVCPSLVPLSRTLSLACFETAYQPFTRQSDQRVREYSRSVESTGRPDPAAADRLARDWLADLAKCDVFVDAEGRAACRYKVAFAVGIAAPRPSVRDDLCQRMAPGLAQGLLATCLREPAGLVPPSG